MTGKSKKTIREKMNLFLHREQTKAVHRIRQIVASALAMTMVMTTPALAADKLIAITFDDGPSVHTTTLLDGLAQREVSATFFMTAQNGSHGINNHGATLTRMWEDGHQLANHTYDHPAIGKLGGAAIQNEVQAVNRLITQYTGGTYNIMMRTPGGAYNETIRANVGEPVILWSLDTWDWKNRNADSVYAAIVNKAHDGGIILLHDLYPTSVSGALRAIDTLKSQGYEFVTVSELMRRRGVTPINGEKYTNFPKNGVNLPAYGVPTVVLQQEDGNADVYMYSEDAGLTFYYTLDGSMPNLSSFRYDGPFAANAGTTTFRVIGIDAYGTRTPSAWLTIEVAYVQQPEPRLENGRLMLTSETPEADFYYTIDGSEPTENSLQYTEEGIPLSTDTVIRCVAAKPGMVNSPVVNCTITPYGDLYTDLPKDSWYYQTVSDITHTGLMTGTGNAQFGPDGAMTTAMVISVLHRFAGNPVMDSQDNFADVATDAWYAESAAWAKQKGLLVADETGNMYPDKVMSRQKLADVLYRYASTTGSVKTKEEAAKSFADWDQVAEGNQSAMIWCVENEIMSGTGDNRLSPEGETTRAQCAAVMLRMQNYLENQPKTVVWYVQNALNECGRKLFHNK